MMDRNLTVVLYIGRAMEQESWGWRKSMRAMSA